MGQQLVILSAATEKQIDEAFATVVERKADAIVYSSNVFFQVARDQLVALAARHSIPAIYEWPEFVQSGGLISYSSTRSEPGSQMGAYAGQILNGAKPAISLSSSRASLNWPLISRPPKRSASLFHQECSPSDDVIQ